MFRDGNIFFLPLKSFLRTKINHYNDDLLQFSFVAIQQLCAARITIFGLKALFQREQMQLSEETYKQFAKKHFLYVPLDNTLLIVSCLRTFQDNRSFLLLLPPVWKIHILKRLHK